MTDVGDRGSGRGGATIDELVALNAEIIALTRAGVPLERGLIDAGSDLPGRLGRIATRLGERMSRGESLSEALAASGEETPRVYRAVVEAGLRSGRLPVALEGLTAYARGYSEARRAIGAALWYPLLLLALAHGLFLAILETVLPRFVLAFDQLGVRLPGGFRGLLGAGRWVWYWGPIVPVGLALVALAWFASGQAMRLGRAGAAGPLRRVPWMGSVLSGFEAAGFADLLALLVEHGVPYPEALTLAGEASGDPRLARSSRALAVAIERGFAPAEALSGPSAFPPLLRWLLATAPRHDNLVSALRGAAERYRGRARHQAEKLRVFLPTILLFGIGGTATLLYALALFIPLTSLWTGLALPTR